MSGVDLAGAIGLALAGLDFTFFDRVDNLALLR
jgi:hypothetical protein